MNINATLIGQSITFLIFVWFCFKYVWPPIRNAMEEREKKIADGLQSAERAQRDLELAKESVSRKLTDAKKEAAGLIEQSNRRAAQIIDEAKQQAEKRPTASNWRRRRRSIRKSIGRERSFVPR